MQKIIDAATASGTYYGVQAVVSEEISVRVAGTWDSATVAVQVSDNPNAASPTYVAFEPDGTALTFTDDTQVCFLAGAGQGFRFVVTVTGTSSINLWAGGNNATVESRT